MLEGLLTKLPPPPNRVNACEGGIEHHLTEGAVMITFAMHLLLTVPGLKLVKIHPDGEHGKRFEFRSWLEKNDFTHSAGTGKTNYAGTYRNAEGQSIIVNPISGVGDVSAELEGRRFVAECKGGVINTKHPGQLSRLKKGLCEAVGLSLCTEAEPGTRQFAVVPRTPLTEKWARKMIRRSALAGVEIALVEESGEIVDITLAKSS